MRKEEFIASLAAEIRDLSKEDIARSLEYYGEMIDERVEDGMSVDEAANALGGVETIAKQIMAELPRERREAEQSAMSGAERMSEETSGEYRVAEPFDSLDVQVGGMDVRIQGSTDDETRIETEHDESVTETVEVRDGVLVIRQEPAQAPKKSWSLFGVRFNLGWSGGGSVTVYLADRLWESIRVKTVSGDIEAEDIRAGTAVLASSSGDIDLRHLELTGRLEAESMSGDVELDSSTAGETALSSMSGDIDLDAVTVASLTLQSKSGDIEIEDTVVEGALRVETISGDVTLYRSDARELRLQSTSGDIEGSLLSRKQFWAHTTSGDVELPASDDDAGRCEAATASGDISLRIAP